jgi:hypothetical protein
MQARPYASEVAKILQELNEEKRPETFFIGEDIVQAPPRPPWKRYLPFFSYLAGICMCIE